MPYSFDTIIDRRNTSSWKVDYIKKFGYPDDVLPLWIADMDFLSPPEVAQAVAHAAEHGIFGYTYTDDDYFDAVASWFQARHGAHFAREWMLTTPGIVFAVAAAINAFTDAGDGVLIQPPVYQPFFTMAQKNGRQTVTNPLLYKDGRYEMDFVDLAQKLSRPDVKLMILCSPHNPIGRIWSREDLLRVGELCNRYGVLLIADEIHCDFAYPGHTHTVYTTLGEEMQGNCVLLNAPSKTFNIAGLHMSSLFVPNPALREKLCDAIMRTGYSGPTVCGLAAAKAAYLHGAPWLEELLVYLCGNVDLVREYVKTYLPGVHMVEPESTYLMWLDFTKRGLRHEELKDCLINKGRVWLDDGLKFGEEGRCFMRLNIASPRSVIADGLKRIHTALKR